MQLCPYFVLNYYKMERYYKLGRKIAYHFRSFFYSLGQLLWCVK